MGKLGTIEQQIASLTRDELARFRAWFASYDGAEQGARIAHDAAA